METNESKTTTEQLLRPTEVATALAVSRETVINLVERGDIPTVRVGRQIRFRRSDIEAFMRGSNAAA
jgi:excisionase family DNA binding protein